MPELEPVTLTGTYVDELSRPYHGFGLVLHRNTIAYEADDDLVSVPEYYGTKITLDADGHFAVSVLPVTGATFTLAAGKRRLDRIDPPEPWVPPLTFTLGDESAGQTVDVTDLYPGLDNSGSGSIWIGDPLILVSLDGDTVVVSHRPSNLAAGTYGALVTDAAGHLRSGTVPVASVSALTTETTRATGAEGTLTTGLASEISRATGAETTEIAARAAAVSAEASTRAAADTALATADTSEATTRASADTAINTALGTTPQGGYSSVAARLAGIDALPGAARMSAASSIGATTLTLRTAPESTMLGRWVWIAPYTTSAELRQVTEISGVTVTVAALANTHAIDAPLLFTNKPVPTPAMYGASIDGLLASATADTTATQAALDAAVALHLPFEFDAGMTSINGTLRATGRTGMSIRGAGTGASSTADNRRSGSILVWYGNTTDALIELRSLRECEIGGFGVYPGQKADSSFYILDTVVRMFSLTGGSSVSTKNFFHDIFITCGGWIRKGFMTTSDAAYSAYDGNNDFHHFVRCGVDHHGTISGYGTSTSGDPTITAVVGLSNFTAGDFVVGENFPEGTTILSIGATTITLSNNATASGTARLSRATIQGTANTTSGSANIIVSSATPWTTGMVVCGVGISPHSLVIAKSGTTLTLDMVATATATGIVVARGPVSVGFSFENSQSKCHLLEDCYAGGLDGDGGTAINYSTGMGPSLQGGSMTILGGSCASATWDIVIGNQNNPVTVTGLYSEGSKGLLMGLTAGSATEQCKLSGVAFARSATSLAHGRMVSWRNTGSLIIENLGCAGGAVDTAGLIYFGASATGSLLKLIGCAFKSETAEPVTYTSGAKVYREGCTVLIGGVVTALRDLALSNIRRRMSASAPAMMAGIGTPTLTLLGIAGSTALPVWTCSDGVSKGVSTTLDLPPAYESGTVTLYLNWAPNTAGDGTTAVRWQWASVGITPATDSINVSSSHGTAMTVVAPTVAKQLTTTTLGTVGVVAGDTIRIEVWRVGADAADTYTADVYLVSVQAEYTANAA